MLTQFHPRSPNGTQASAEGRKGCDGHVAPPGSPERAAFARAGVDGRPRRWSASVWLIAICQLLFANCQRSDATSIPKDWQNIAGILGRCNSENAWETVTLNRFYSLLKSVILRAVSKAGGRRFKLLLLSLGMISGAPSFARNLVGAFPARFVRHKGWEIITRRP